MDNKLELQSFPKYIKLFILCFVISLTVGYVTGLLYVENTTNFTPDGIDLQYNGNEVKDDLWEDDFYNEIEQTPIKYKKNKREIISIIHSHIISFSLIFFALGILITMTSISNKIKSLLIIEPFISIILTFGGIYFLWLGHIWIKYIIMISGIVLTISFIISVLIIIYELLKKTNPRVN